MVDFCLPQLTSFSWTEYLGTKSVSKWFPYWKKYSFFMKNTFMFIDWNNVHLAFKIRIVECKQVYRQWINCHKTRTGTDISPNHLQRWRHHKENNITNDPQEYPDYTRMMWFVTLQYKISAELLPLSDNRHSENIPKSQKHVLISSGNNQRNSWNQVHAMFFKKVHLVSYTCM